MTPQRREAQKYILSFIDNIAPGGENKQIYTEMFDGMTDEQFDSFMSSIDKDENRLALIIPNFGKTGVTTERNLTIAKEMGHEFFQHIWIEGDPGSGDPTYLTPVKYLVVDLPLRRQAQVLVKKISIPEDNKTVDDFTGQPTGRSKGSKISFPETNVMAAMGLDMSLIEWLKYRGGDTKGFNAMNNAINKTGGVSLKSISHLAGGVESTKTFKTYLTGMHLSSSL
jgi:hypothetical protein